MVADILGDDAVTLLDIAYYRVNDDNKRHIQHVWYEAFVMKVTVWPLVQHVTMDCQLCFGGLSAIFQYNTEGGPLGLRVKLQEYLLHFISKKTCTHYEQDAGKQMHTL